MLTALVIMSVNYLSGQTWLVDGNLANVVGQRAQISGWLGSGLPYVGLMETVLLALTVLMPIGYGTAQLDDDSFRLAYPLLVFGVNFLFMHLNLFPNGGKTLSGLFVLLIPFVTHETCKVACECLRTDRSASNVRGDPHLCP